MGDSLQTIVSPSVYVKGDKVSSPSVSEFGDNVQINQSQNCVIRQCGVQLNAPPNLQSIVRHPILAIRVPCSIIIIANNWPCWLVPALALTLPLAGAYFLQQLRHLFQVPPTFSGPKLMTNWSSMPDFLELQLLLSCPLTFLASGTEAFLTRILEKLKDYQCPLIYAVDRVFNQFIPKDVRRLTNYTRATWTHKGFDSAVAYHS